MHGIPNVITLVIIGKYFDYGLQKVQWKKEKQNSGWRELLNCIYFCTEKNIIKKGKAFNLIKQINIKKLKNVIN